MSLVHAKSVNIADAVNTAVVRPSDWNSVHMQSITLEGNTLGGALVTGTNIVLSGGSNITLSADGASIGIVGANPPAASGSNGSFLFSTLKFETGNGATFYTDATGIRLSYTVPTAQSVQPVAASGSNGSFLFSTLQFVTGNGATFITDATGIRLSYTVPAAQSVQPVAASGSNGSFLFSTLQFVTGNGATFITDATGIRLSYTVPAAQSVQPVAASGSNGSFLFSTLQFVTGNGATFITDATGIRLSYTVPSQTVQPVAASGSNGSFLFSTLQFVTGNGATFITDATGIRLSYTVPAAQSVQPVAASGSNGSFLFSTLQFVTGNGASFYTDATGIRLTYTVPTLTSEPAFTAWSLVGNTLGTNVSANAGMTNLYLSGGPNVTISGNSNSIVFSVQSEASMSQLDPFHWQNVTDSTLGQSTIYIVPFTANEYVYGSRVNFFLSHTYTYSGGPNNQTFSNRFGYALYTRGVGADSANLNMSTSYSLVYASGSCSSSTRLSMTNYIGLSNVTSHSTSQYGVNNASVSNYLANSIVGYRVLALPLNVTLTPGAYWMAVSNQTASQNASFVLACNVLQAQFSNNIAYRVYGSVSAASNASFFPASNGVGIYSAQSAAFPAAIPLNSDSIRAALIVTLPYFNISGIGTAVDIL